MTNLLKSWEYDTETLNRNASIIVQMYKKLLCDNRRIPTLDEIENLIESYNFGAISQSLGTTDMGKIADEYERLEQEESAFTMMSPFIVRVLASAKAAVVDTLENAVDNGQIPERVLSHSSFVIHHDAQNILVPVLLQDGVASQGEIVQIVSQAKQNLLIGAS